MKPARYAQDLIASSAKARSAHGPGIFSVRIAHDEWCDLLAGKGPCNCNPEVGEVTPAASICEALFGLPKRPPA